MEQSIKITVSEFRTRYPISTSETANLEKEIATAFSTVWTYVRTYSSINWEKKNLSDFQIEKIKDATASQVMYDRNSGGSLTQESGVGIEGSVVPSVEMDQRRICPESKAILERYGFLYRGLF